MDTYAIKAAVAMPSFLMATLTGEIVPEKLNTTLVNAAFSDVEPIRSSANEAHTESSQTITYKEAAKEWTKQMARRFEELAIAEALGTITREQASELEALTKDRRSLEYPRTVEEMLWEHKQRRVATELLNAVKAYAKFYDSSNNQRS
jgi:hypothetical protein